MRRVGAGLLLLGSVRVAPGRYASQMFPIYRAGSLHEASLLGDRLHEAGLGFDIRNQQLQGALGELPLSVTPEVCVRREADVVPARRIVAAFETAQRTPIDDDLRCGECGEQNPSNFELCWSCRAELG
jgi:hypothetical protein